MDEILDLVCLHYNVPLESVKGRGRYMEIVEARHVSQYLMYNKGFSYPQIARFFGQDHTTVMHSRKKIQGFIDTNQISIKLIENRVNALKFRTPQRIYHYEYELPYAL